MSNGIFEKILRIVSTVVTILQFALFALTGKEVEKE